MSLRLKLALLLGMFCLFMIGSVLSASWCLGVYLDASFSDFQRASFLAGAVEDMRDQLHARGPEALSPETLNGWRSTVDTLESGGLDQAAVDSLRSALEDLHQAGSTLPGERPLGSAEIDPAPLARLAAELREVRGLLSERRKSAHDGAYAVQRIILAVLTANIIMGCALVGLAFLAVQRWITRPILRLHQAAEHFAAGRLDYRLPVGSQDELGQLCTQINAMAASLTESQKKLLEQERQAAFGELTRAVAHNMRNPLASIRACAQSSVMHLTDDPQASEQCHKIIEIVDDCERWIRNLLQVNRPVEITPARTEVGPLIHRVVEASRPFAERRQVALRVYLNGPATVMLDAQLFEQAMAAVVSNAVEASPAGQAVRLEVRSEPTPEPALLIDVRDGGSGVPHELRGKVFEPYFTTKPTGTGIGLHFARRVVRAHHGELTVVDAGGGAPGACFRICLPLYSDREDSPWPES